LLFIYDLEYTVRKVQESQKELEFTSTNQLLAFADDVNLFGENMYLIGNREAELKVNS
jgi:hypothetical protein